MLSHVSQVARFNRFADPATFESKAQGFEKSELAGHKVLLLTPEKSLTPQPDSSGLSDFYIMDPASIFAAEALGVQEGDEVLDLCAAPGGKSLILFEEIGSSGRLVANEISDRRRGRLKAVMHDYIPKVKLAQQLKVTGHDGGRWCLYEKSAYDRVLLDAPCSGERHLLDDESELKKWSPSRGKNLAIRQYALLASAVQTVRSGGRIVYSTCSISPLENDGIIAKLLKKRPDEVEVLSFPQQFGEATEYGWAITPDRTGYGPIYFSCLRKL